MDTTANPTAPRPLVPRLSGDRPPAAAAPSFMTYKYQHSQSEVWHSHKTAQLTYASQGAIKVYTATGIWTLPPYRALWIPSELPHQTHALGDAVTYNLYFPENPANKRVTEFCPIPVSGIIHYLIEELAKPGETEDARRPRFELMLSLLLHELDSALPAPVAFLPSPRERRLCAITRLLTDNPGNNDTLDQLSAGVGATPRTLSRLFRHDTGLTFSQWRQQLNIMESISLMAQGYSIEDIAGRLGYFNGSAFIAMFRKAMGATPQRYFNILKE